MVAFKILVKGNQAVLSCGGVKWSDLGGNCDPRVISVYRPKTGFQLWLEENRKSITADQPDLEETSVIKEAMGRFRILSAEERLVPQPFQIRFIISSVILTVFGLKGVKVHIKRSSSGSI